MYLNNSYEIGRRDGCEWMVNDVNVEMVGDIKWCQGPAWWVYYVTDECCWLYEGNTTTSRMVNEVIATLKYKLKFFYLYQQIYSLPYYLRVFSCNCLPSDDCENLRENYRNWRSIVMCVSDGELKIHTKHGTVSDPYSTNDWWYLMMILWYSYSGYLIKGCSADHVSRYPVPRIICLKEPR